MIHARKQNSTGDWSGLTIFYFSLGATSNLVFLELLNHELNFPIIVINVTNFFDLPFQWVYSSNNADDVPALPSSSSATGETILYAC